MEEVIVMHKSLIFKPDELLPESATNLKPKVFKWWKELVLTVKMFKIIADFVLSNH